MKYKPQHALISVTTRRAVAGMLSMLLFALPCSGAVTILQASGSGAINGTLSTFSSRAFPHSPQRISRISIFFPNCSPAC